MRGPCRPQGYEFPKTQHGKAMRSFREAWFESYPWLEYSMEKDAAYCLYCYLFDNPSIRSETFTSKGFSN